VPLSDVEINIYGEDGEIPMASWFMCESCGDIYFSISELGFCVSLDESMQAALDEYRDFVETES